MTRRRATIPRREIGTTLSCVDEVAAAGMLRWLWIKPEHRTRSWWAAVKRVHGERITAKVREAMPGCRPGFDYALGIYPPLPLMQAVPSEHLRHRDHIDVDGVRHWHVGGPWQRSQAEHLREIGEVDGAEWRRHLAWKRAGFPATYTPDDNRLGRPCGTIRHCCH